MGVNIFIYDIDLIDGAMIGELARRSIKKYEKMFRLYDKIPEHCAIGTI